MLSKIIHQFFRIIKTDLDNQDLNRRALILNILLASIIGLAITGYVSWNISAVFFSNDFQLTKVNVEIIVVFIFLPLSLLFLSKKGYPTIASSILIGSLLLAVLHTTYSWGIDLPQVVVMYALLIIFTGILISEKSALAIFIIIAFSLSLIFYLQTNDYVLVDNSWRLTEIHLMDLIVLNVTYGVITLVSSLSSREISKALDRAQKSESVSKKLARALKKERDHLEITVQKRTLALRQVQLEKMQQLYQTVEIGRTAAGLLHDLNSPLTVIRLNLDKLQSTLDKEITNSEITKLSQSTSRALLASQKISEMVQASRNQLLATLEPIWFKPVEEINLLVTLFEHRLRLAHISIKIVGSEKWSIFSYQAQFCQVIANLLSNAIDSFPQKRHKNKLIILKLQVSNNQVSVLIIDNGMGIKKDYIDTIFNPFFSTKSQSGGTGLGLYICKKITEQTLSGRIYVNSSWGKGSQFTIVFPPTLKTNYESD